MESKTKEIKKEKGKAIVGPIKFPETPKNVKRLAVVLLDNGLYQLVGTDLIRGRLYIFFWDGVAEAWGKMLVLANLEEFI